VVQRHHGGHAALLEAAQHGAVFFQRVFVPLVGLRLDAAPLDGDTLRVLVTFGGAVEVLPPAPAPPIAGQPRLAVGVALLLPLPPLVVGVVALHLVGGRRAAPQEPAREVKRGVNHFDLRD
jgi:hypothetical protein